MTASLTVKTAVVACYELIYVSFYFN